MPRFRLTYHLDGERHEVELTAPRVSIGRNPDSEVPIFDDSVSRVHATIVADDRGWIVRDAGSRNGIYVNLQRVTERRLQHRDLLILGRVEITFEVVEGPAGAGGSSITFADREGDPFVSQSINVSDFH
ncbi:MAG: FHA domain-containing protein, partial [Planctomycetes bacterium]|nr:FHA domain-containing protein [Planctomycetota bacterium]